MIRVVSREVFTEESQIFHDCEGPSKRTIELIGHTGEKINYGSYNMCVFPYKSIDSVPRHGCPYVSSVEAGNCT